MAFSDAVINEARRNSLYRCVLCDAWLVEVHHIIPQEEGGPDTLDNACPLCGGCHNIVGANPELRKQLRGTRDLKWAMNKMRSLTPDTQQFVERLDHLQSQISGLSAATSQTHAALGEIKDLVIGHYNQSNVAVGRADSVSMITTAVTGYMGPPGK